jgi:hypothetical protein
MLATWSLCCSDYEGCLSDCVSLPDYEGCLPLGLHAFDGDMVQKGRIAALVT